MKGARANEMDLHCVNLASFGEQGSVAQSEVMFEILLRSADTM